MNQTIQDIDIDLFSGTLPSMNDISRLSAVIHAGQAAFAQFNDQLESNLSKTSSAAKLASGIGLYLTGQYKKAVEKLEKADDGLEKFLFLAFALTHLKQYDAALENLDKADECDADKLAIILEKTNILRLARQYDQAWKVLNSCSAAQKKNADYHYHSARLMEAQGNYLQAVEHYKKAIELEPGHSQALFHLAYRCDMFGDDQAAIDYYRQIAAGSPVYVSALLNLAVLYEDMDQYEKAMRCIDKVLKFHPSHPRAILFKKDVQSSMNMYYDEEKERRKDHKHKLLETPISDFELSVRSRNCLRKMNIRTVGDLLNTTEAELLAYKNFGETSLREIKNILDAKNLRLGLALEEDAKVELEQAEPKPEEDQGMLNNPVTDLKLSVRARKCLTKLNIHTIGELVRKTEAELLGCKNFGVTSLNEIKKALNEFGLSLRVLD